MTNKSKRAVSAMSDDEFDNRFPNEKAAVDWFIDIRYSGNLVCPYVDEFCFRQNTRPTRVCLTCYYVNMFCFNLD